MTPLIAAWDAALESTADTSWNAPLDPRLDDAPCGYLVVTDDGALVTTNATLPAMLGYADGTFTARSVNALLTPASRVFWQTHLFPLLRVRGRVDELYLALRTAAGGELGVLVNAVRQTRDGVAANACVVVPVRERAKFEGELVRARRAADAAEAWSRSLVEASTDCIETLDLDGRVRTVNAPGLRALEVDDVAAVVGVDWTTLWPADARPTAAAAVAAARAGEPTRFRACWPTSAGTPRWWDVLVAPIAGPDGRPARLLASLRDVTERAALEAELARRAHHDALTGLANRVQLHARIGQVLAAEAGCCGERGAAGGAASGVAVLLLDLDGFKRVNDSAGHAAGDALLVQVAERLRRATRGCDLVARLGGDEFAVLLEGVRDVAALTAVADRVVAALARPFLVHGTGCVVGASVGIAHGADLTAAPDVAAQSEALLRNADLALYAAKARGKGQYAFYAPAMHATAVERVTVEAALRHALARGEFRLVYQPIVDLATGAPVGAEALVRWEHPARGRVSPAEFVPLAEETGLIVPLGRWILETACREAAAWPAAGGAEVGLTVNVSGRQLERPEFVAEVEAALVASGLAPARLTLELTESTVIHDPERAIARLAALKALGVRLAVDDFGTGYSSLGYLQQFPLDVLKIDKRFVDPVAGGGRAAALAAAIVGLGAALDLRTVAEGIESAAQAEALRAMRCAFGQGYHFARPLDADAIGPWLASAVPNATPTDVRAP